MAPGDVAALRAGEGHGQHLPVEQGNDPAHGTDEIVAVGGPSLAARPLQIHDETGEHIRQQIGHGHGGHALGGEDVFDPVDLATLQILRGEALAAGESDGGLGRLAPFVEGDLGRRALVFLEQRLGGIRHIVGHHDYAPGGGEDLEAAVGDTRILQGPRHHLLQLLDRRMQIERGDLLYAYLEGEGVRARHARPPSLPRRPAAGPRPCPCRRRSNPSPCRAPAGCRPCARWR